MYENLRFRKRLVLLEKQYGREQCWPYPAKPYPNGYCVVYVKWADGSEHKMVAHKLAYLMLIGNYEEQIEVDGKVCRVELDHTCKNPRCCNPWHLEPVTYLENWSRGNSLSAKRSRQTHCKNGHPLEGDNLIVWTSRNGRPSRVCRTCNNAWYRERRALFPDRYHGYDRVRGEQRKEARRLKRAIRSEKKPDNT
jgi:hypothetical protein